MKPRLFWPSYLMQSVNVGMHENQHWWGARQLPLLQETGRNRRLCCCWRPWSCTRTTGTRSASMWAPAPRTSVFCTSWGCRSRTPTWRIMKLVSSIVLNIFVSFGKDFKVEREGWKKELARDSKIKMYNCGDRHKWKTQCLRFGNIWFFEVGFTHILFIIKKYQS